VTADKRTPHTDALDTLGYILGPDEKRDAIHLAVEPVIAGQPLRAGDHVTLRDGVAVKVKPGIGLGIVDPFIDGPVEKGERFWLVVYPRQITSLRHVWEHPAFPASGEANVPAGDKAASEAWLRDFIKKSDCPGYDYVIALACGDRIVFDDNYGPSVNDGEYLHFNGLDAHGVIPDEFWDHLEVVTGRKFGKHDRASYFSCSC
jgi:hypothetical protein